MGAVEVDGKVDQIAAVDPATGFKVVDVQPLEGRPEDLGAEAIAVHRDTATDKDLLLGDLVPVRFKDTGLQQLRVVLIYGENQPSGDWLLGKAAYEANFTNRYDWQVYVKKAPGTSLALDDEGIEVFRVPGPSLVVVVLLGALAGVAAAVLPSRRAARLDVLRAVVTE